MRPNWKGQPPQESLTGNNGGEMSSIETTIELARQHVISGRKIVAQQRAIIASLREMGRDTRDAEQTLELFEQSLTIFEDHLRELTARSNT